MVGDSTVCDPVIVPVRDPVIVPVLEPVIVPLREMLEPVFEPVMVPLSATGASESIRIVAVNSICPFFMVILLANECSKFRMAGGLSPNAPDS